MEIEKIVGKEITFMHNSNYWPNRKVSEKEERFDKFLYEQAIPYLVKLCNENGIKADIDYAGTMGVKKSNIQFMSYNMFGGYYGRGVLDTPQAILEFSFQILGDKIKLN